MGEGWAVRQQYMRAPGALMRGRPRYPGDAQDMYHRGMAGGALPRGFSYPQRMVRIYAHLPRVFLWNIRCIFMVSLCNVGLESIGSLLSRWKAAECLRE